mmetsp:Transcript_25127/g.38878  ORF Transcript_25127/g.38878 Transcript_25127/m.38878 type:complete len:472 (+) Transcript_25127:148-1563(+)
MRHPNTEGLEALAALCGGVSASYNGPTTQAQQNPSGTASQQTTMTGNASNNTAQIPVHRPSSAPQQQAPLHGYQHGSNNSQSQPEGQRMGAVSYAAGGQQSQTASSQAGNLLAQQALNFYLQQQLIAAAIAPGQAQQQAPAQNIQQHQLLYDNASASQQHHQQQIQQIGALSHQNSVVSQLQQHENLSVHPSNPSVAGTTAANYDMPPPPSRSTDGTHVVRSTSLGDDNDYLAMAACTTPEEKKQLKRAANRKSAQLSRKRKKQFIEELRSENDELRKKELILRSIPDLIVVFDSAGKIHFTSHSVTKLLNYNPDELEGASFWERISNDSVRSLKSAFMDALAARKPGTDTAPLEGISQLKLLDRDGQKRVGTMNGVIHFSGDAPECVCSIRLIDGVSERFSPGAQYNSSLISTSSGRVGLNKQPENSSSSATVVSSDSSGVGANKKPKSLVSDGSSVISESGSDQSVVRE